ncbi:MAG: hypothetical protein HOM25_12000 [Rhodospirillaceae bacterium]|jgi:hypothetical protein|nr:hypothetical protein [Rhodospirillaceae bacterium]MBT5665650.1 hypothetical protein [Rhodospirillaceae bacterium]
MKQTPIASRIAEALSANLSQQEIAELDEIITPRVSDLFVKAFGPEMASLLSPFTEGDDENGESPQDNQEQDVKEKEAALRALMRDPRYWRERDPTVYRRQVGSGDWLAARRRGAALAGRSGHPGALYGFVGSDRN